MQLLNRPNTNSFLTQAFNLSIIHISNNARGQKISAPLAHISARLQREGGLMHYSGRARLDCSPCSRLLEATIISPGHRSLVC